MTGEDALAAWAPEEGRWSPWVKPVLFAHAERISGDDADAAFRDSHLPSDWHTGLVAPRTALIIELPGVQAVAAGAAASDLGFRPIPLFNALPGPPGKASFSFGQRRQLPIAAVDVRGIVVALVTTAPRLRGGGLRGAGMAPDAPPAFLIDSRRLDARGPLYPGRFDNRSAHTVTDFPSAKLLREAGIERVVVVLNAALPGWDLSPTLEGWRRGQIAIAVKRLGGSPQAWPGRWGTWLLRMGTWFRRLTLRGNGRKGFGGWIPASSG